MKVVRAIRKDDLDGLMYLATQVGGGMTTLKPDKKMLSKRIAVACDSFAEKNPPEQRDYLFVMEETESGHGENATPTHESAMTSLSPNLSPASGREGRSEPLRDFHESEKIIGVCAIKSTVGLEEPFYNYRLGTLVHSSKELNVYSRMQTLYLSNDLTGCSELCSLFLHPDYRNGISGKLLSKSRFLFIAQFPHLFSEKLIAELRGFQRPDGSSPFWDSLGRHFFQMDFSRADALVSTSGKKSFIAELMPRHPLYAAYLPTEAQDAIGKVHVDTEPARHLLEEEGFFCEGYVDIFDAGPVMQARVSKLRSLRRSELVEVIDATNRSTTLNKIPTLVANTSMLDYRIILSEIAPENGKLQLTAEQKQVMSCSAHSHVRVMSLKP